MGGRVAYQDIRLDVHKGHLCPLPERLVLRVDPILFTNVKLKPPCSQCPLFLAQPPCRAREVWEYKEAAECYGDCNDAFYQEEPLPGTQAPGPVHVRCDSGGYQPGECPRDKRPRVEHRSAEAKLFSRVPAAEIIQTAGLDIRLDEAVRGEGSERRGVTHKVCGFDETEEESHGKETAVVGDARSRCRDGAPDDHLNSGQYIFERRAGLCGLSRTHIGRYRAGFPILFMYKLDGICINTYLSPTSVLVAWRTRQG